MPTNNAIPTIPTPPVEPRPDQTTVPPAPDQPATPLIPEPTPPVADATPPAVPPVPEVPQTPQAPVAEPPIDYPAQPAQALPAEQKPTIPQSIEAGLAPADFENRAKMIGEQKETEINAIKTQKVEVETEIQGVEQDERRILTEVASHEANNVLELKSENTLPYAQADLTASRKAEGAVVPPKEMAQIGNTGVWYSDSKISQPDGTQKQILEIRLPQAQDSEHGWIKDLRHLEELKQTLFQKLNQLNLEIQRYESEKHIVG